MTSPGPDFPEFEIRNDRVPSVKRFNWLSLIQFVVSLLSGLFFVGGGILSGFVMLAGEASPAQVIPKNQILSSCLFSAGLVFAGLLMIPSIIFSARTLFDFQPDRMGGKYLFAKQRILTVIFPLLILVGYLAQQGPSWAQAFLPVIHPLANAAAVFWVLGLVYRKTGRKWFGRFWGVFGSGLTVLPLIAFIAEILILIILGLIWMLILSSQPGVMEELILLVGQLQSDSISPSLLEESTRKIFGQSGIAATIFLYIAVFIPLIEEVIKPAVLWFALGKKLSPRDGFLLGSAAGAGYALFENLTIGASAEIWTFVTITRMGTAAVHILTSGLVGWGTISAISNKKFLRLLGAYLSAVALHGVWNGLNILNALTDIPSARDTLTPAIVFLADYAPEGLILLAFGSLIGIIRANIWIRRAIITPSLEESEVRWKS